MRNIGYLGLVACALLASAGPAAACTTFKADLARLIKDGDVTGAERKVGEIGTARECGPADRRGARRDFADGLLDRAATLRRGGPSRAAEADQLVQKAAAQNISWRASLEFGQVSARAKSYAAAAEAYQVALNLATDREERNPPARQVIDDLVRRADEARHLAAAGPSGKLVAAPPTRSGEPGGVFVHRGAEAVRVPPPILFEYRLDQFTSVGRQAAEELAELLKLQAPGTIVVTGHTDRIGGEEYNMDLSRKRAARVAQFLAAAGVKAKVTVVAKGKSEPRQLSDPSIYTQEQKDELDRRVEFDWQP